MTDSIQCGERQSERFAEFDKGVAAITGVEMLRFLMEQNSLTGSDLPEIGGKANVSKVLSGDRNLTKAHIEALSKRFHVSPALFF